MEFVNIQKNDSLAIIRLERGKVHALNDQVIKELQETLQQMENDNSISAIILTGTGKFFSFGFDIPGFMDYSPEAFTGFVTRFTDLYTYMFLYPKPIIAAINGHAIAGGCMLVTAADYRIMVTGKSKISLNEITFGALVFAGSVEMLKFCAGERNAELILASGDMYSAEEAQKMGLIDRVTAEDELMKEAQKTALAYAAKEFPAFTGIKRLLRKPVAERMIALEKESIREFIKVWYLPATREYLRKIEIH